MTPPDSGARRTGKSHLHVGKECGPSCPDGNGIEFKPDSGAREVCSVCGEHIGYGGCMYNQRGYLNPADHETDKAAAKHYRRGYERLAAMACLEPSLAQRILAALESHALARDCPRCGALAAKLRERLPK